MAGGFDYCVILNFFKGQYGVNGGQVNFRVKWGQIWSKWSKMSIFQQVHKVQGQIVKIIKGQVQSNDEVKG